MLIPGLVSVTFRQKTPEEICALCAKNGLRAIEWGGDVHVPPENPENAARVGEMTRAAGLEVCSYGSYYRLGEPDERFDACLEAACRLGAPVMRIWAGSKASSETAEEERRALVSQLRALSEKAKRRGVFVACEYHGWTLTDCRESARRLERETRDFQDAFGFYWQPRWDWPEEERLASLDELGGRLSHVHAFTWSHEDGQTRRHPLEDGAAMWQKAISRWTGERRYLLLEFVEGDADEALEGDARTLRTWIRER